VPRWVKLVLWLGVFGVCAGVGAFVAAHTDPFPPGVEDPGSRSTPPTPTSPGPTSQRWTFVMNSATRHDLHVGGSCRSRWHTSGHITVQPNGSAEGEARADVRGWGCDFPVAQVQTRIVRLSVTGASSEGRLVLRFSETGASPTGSQDLGGFRATIRLLVAKVELASGHGGAPTKAARPDGDLGRFASAGPIYLDCATDC
jgi:hypothetical protein